MGKRKPDNAIDFAESAFENGIEASLAYRRLLNMAIARFTWDNVPKGCDMRYFELVLIREGKGTIFYEPAYDEFLSLGVADIGALNVYGVCSEYNAISANDRQFRTLNIETAPICWNNLAHTPDRPIIYAHAKKIWKYERNAEINADLQKYAAIIKTTEEQRLTMKNIFMKFDGNQPFIWADKTLDLSGLETLDLHIPFIADKLLEIKQECYADAMTDLGIVNFQSDKRERLTAVETYGELGSTELIQQSALKARQDFCNEFNAIHGTELSVRLTSTLDIGGVVNNGNLYGYTANPNAERV